MHPVNLYTISIESDIDSRVVRIATTPQRAHDVDTPPEEEGQDLDTTFVQDTDVVPGTDGITPHRGGVPCFRCKHNSGHCPQPVSRAQDWG